MANLQMNIRANVRGNAAQRTEANFAAEVAMRTGGLQIDAGVQVRGGPRVHFAHDDYRAAGNGRTNVHFSATGLGDIGGMAASFYGGNVDGFQFEAKANKKRFRARMEGADHVRNQTKIAINMGTLQPGQGARFEAQIGDVRAFAQMQMGGGMGMEMGFQNDLNSMFQQQQMFSAVQQQGNMLHSLGMADQMLMQRMGMQEQNFGMFANQVGQQFGQINGQLGQLYQHDIMQDQMLQANTNGLGQLSQDLLGLTQQQGGLQGLVGGLTDRLGALDGSFAAYRTSTDSQIAGANKELASLLEQLNSAKTDLAAQLAAAKKEIDDLKTQTAANDTRIEGKVDALAGRVETGFKELRGQIDSVSNTLGTKIDAEVAKLTATDAVLAGDLKTLRGEYDSFAKQTTDQLAEQGKRLDAAFKEIGETKTQLTTQLADVEAKLTKAIADGDTALQNQLTAQRTDITTLQGQVADHEGRLKTAEDTLTKQAGQIGDAMKLAEKALATGQDAKGLAEWLRGQVKDLRGDVNQLQTNDHSFSALLSQWHGALDWRWGHILVNQGMSGNAHTRFDPLFVNMKGGDFKFEGKVETDMLTGANLKTKWLAAGDTADTAALLLDPAELKKAGFILQNSRGEELDKPQLFRDGLRLQKVGAPQAEIIGDGWQLMKLLDTNKDGRINKDDTTIGAIKTWFDSGTTLGSIDAKDKLQTFLEAGLGEINLGGIKEKRMVGGDQFQDGEIKLASGVAASITDVNFGNKNE